MKRRMFLRNAQSKLAQTRVKELIESFETKVGARLAVVTFRSLAL